MSTTTERTDDTDSPRRLDALRTYIDGKMKRYNLLFAVNGGAFAIAKLGSDNQATIGNLDLLKLAVGAIIFTIVLTADIWLWAQQMKETHLRGETHTFSLAGKTVVLLLSSLLILAWALAAEFHQTGITVAFVAHLLAVGAAHTLVKQRTHR